MSDKSTEIETALLEAKTSLLVVLSEARKHFSKHEETFVDHHSGVLMNGLSIYETLFKKCGCQDESEFKGVIQKGGRKLKLLAEEVLDAEDDWMQFLRDVEKTMNTSEESQVLLNIGDLVSLDPILHPVKEGSHEIKEELSSYGLQVVILCFGCLEGGQRWLEDTKCCFPLFSDPTRHLYRIFGLKRSIVQVWDLESVKYYASKLVKGVPLPSPYPNIKDDIYQLGGDFILDSKGKVILVYRSRNPSDRPSVQLIIDSIKAKEN